MRLPRNKEITVKFPVKHIRKLFKDMGVKIAPEKLEALLENKKFIEALTTDLVYAWVNFNENEQVGADDILMGLMGDPEDRGNLWKKFGIQDPYNG